MDGGIALPTALIAATGGSTALTPSSLSQKATSFLSSTAATTSTSASESSATAAVKATATAASSSAYALPDALPHTTNRWIAVAGDLALYNPTLLLVAAALLQHTAVFGILFLLRGFSPRRALDLHYLTIVFALSFVAAPIVFLADLRIDQIKLLFFLEHEAVEFLIAIRVLAPAVFVAKWSGLIVLLCWCSLVAVTVPVVWDTAFHHAADLVAWCAFASDFLVGLSGLALIRRWLITRSATTYGWRKLGAEAMAGLGFAIHGFVTMSVGPIFALVLYHDLNPAYFAYAWVGVFLSAFFAVGFAVPCAGLFFQNLRWPVSHRRAIFPGQAEWYEERENTGLVQPRDKEQYEEWLGGSEMDTAPKYTVNPPTTPGLEDMRRPHSPDLAWNVQLPEERTSTWRSFKASTADPANSNIYYREVLKDLLTR